MPALSEQPPSPESPDQTDPPGFAPDFYVTGGTLPTDAPSYVVRQADTDLLRGLLAGDFCYVLNTRQMGKSSLMVRTARRLREERGASVCLVDLTAIGQNLSPAQWYGGLLSQIATQLDEDGDLEDEALRFWRGAPELGPMRRFFEALGKVVLPRAGDAPLVVFVDEVDAARSLPFPADEFFAGIRECYNRRAIDARFERLTFCLLGVATPADLISDARMSPFNIGRRIRLEDFTEREAAPLARALPGGLPTLRRVLHWTGGHPYLTQRLLRQVSEQAVSTPAEVDALCQRLFLTRDARETDDNLAFVRNRLLHGGADLAALLDLYQRVRAGRRVKDDETNPLCAALRLAGVVKADVHGFLRVRNRIYDHVFDADWVAAHLPGAEARRQRAAFRRGALRATLVGAGVVAAVGALAVVALRQADQARRLERVAQERLSQTNAQNGLRLLEEGDPLGALGPLSEALRIDAAASPSRLPMARVRLAAAQRRAPRVVHTVACGSPILCARPSPAGDRFVTATQGGAARVWDAATGAPRTPEMRHPRAVRYAAFSPDGTKVATACEDGRVRLWDAGTGAALGPPLAYHTIPGGSAERVDWSRDGRYVAASGTSAPAVWDAATGRVVSRVYDISDPGTPIRPWGEDSPGVFDTRAVAFAPGGNRLVFVASSYLANFADTRSGRMNGVLPSCYSGGQVQYAPDGRRVLAAGSFFSSREPRWSGAALYDARTGRMLTRLPHQEAGVDAQFSPDGKAVATAAQDGTARVWDAATGRPVTPPLPHYGGLVTVRFSPDGRRIVTASQDGTAQAWDARTGDRLGPLLRQEGPLRGAFFVGVGPGPRVLTAGMDGRARLWEMPGAEGPNGRLLTRMPDGKQYDAVVFLPEVTRYVTVRGTRRGEQRDIVSVYDTAAGRRIFPAPGAPQGISAVASLHGRWVFAYDGRRLHAWDVEGRRKVWEAGAPAAITAFGVAEGPNPEAVTVGAAAADGRETVTAYRIRDGAPLAPPFDRRRHYWSAFDDTLHTLPAGHEVASVGSPSGRFVPLVPLVATQGPEIAAGQAELSLWDVRTGRRHPLAQDARRAQLIYSPDERGLLVNGREARLWDTETGKLIGAPLKSGARVLDATFSPDGRRVATGSDDGMAQVWDARTARPASPPIIHRGNVLVVAFHPDGRTLATVSSDGTARVWDSETGEPLTPTLRQEGGIRQCGFTEGGDSLVTAGSREIRVWRLTPDRV